MTLSNTREQHFMIDHIIPNENAAEIFLNVQIYRGLEIGSDHFFVQGVIRLKISRILNGKIKK